ncbi:hypothetical protein L208DRAFT_1374636 [Tricholoma matsutake]|nr:hypothetical protein L208DRAFT_1374636 [Tricholoma matsutake 945]
MEYYAIRHAYQLTVEAFGWNSERGTVGGDIIDSISFDEARGAPGAACSSHAFRRIASYYGCIMEYALSSPFENVHQAAGDITVSAREINEGQAGKPTPLRSTLFAVLWRDRVHLTVRNIARPVVWNIIWVSMWEALGVASGAPAIADVNIPAAEQIESLNTPVNTALNPPTSTMDCDLLLQRTLAGKLLNFATEDGMETVIDVTVDAALNNLHNEWETKSPSELQKDWNRTWDAMWSSARDGALMKAKSIVQHIQKHSHRSAARDWVWDTIWEAWNSGFTEV